MVNRDVPGSPSLPQPFLAPATEQSRVLADRKKQQPSDEVQAQRSSVTTLSGSELELPESRYVTWYENQQEAYLRENTFGAGDLFDLEQLLSLEVQVQILNSQIASGKRNGIFLTNAEIAQMQRRLKDSMAIASKLKTDLRLTKASQESSADSVGAYLDELRKRAKEYGVRRSRQTAEAINILMEMKGVIGAFDRATEREREAMGYPDEAAILNRFRQHMPKFDAIDQAFRAQQSRWISKI